MKKNLPILLALALFFLTNSAYSQQTAPLIRFGLIADIQYGNCDTRGSRFYGNSLDKLKDCVSDLNSHNVQFTLNLGDITDRNPDDLEPVLSLLRQLDSTVYNTTGNHDYAGIKNNKALFNKLSMHSEYYSFKRGDWRFVMLNTNEVASYANIARTRKQKELVRMLESIKARKGNNAEGYNGGVSSRQLKWLNKLLKATQKNGEKVLIFSHHPLSHANGFTALNDKEILDVITAYNCVKAIISGHHHTGSFGYYKSVPCIVTEGMVETKDTNAYGIVEIFTNEIVLTGKGGTRSYKLPIR